ncbi:putative peptide maturation dehydrogenase [Pseudoxanthomonas sp. J35]|uniref:putative peptide maturation dehydrogenase n=1 Tax=Pseudoxanthomonas sp. J35 TaxID=935852 RepID=UPI00048BF9DC|nr:putative peptide maturation dehydrogenase [Pseudoxanthomonas sp. J35]
MRVRRCRVLYIEPREDVEFDLADVLRGGDGLASRMRWLALAPHLAREVELDARERELLGRLSAERWVDRATLDGDARKALPRLLREGLVLGSGKRHAAMRQREEALREVHWDPLAATMHAFTRWEDADAVRSMEDTGTVTIEEVRELFGAPPPAVPVPEDDALLQLPRAARGDFDALLSRRVTCRNFDTARPLPRTLFAQVLERVFAAHGKMEVTADTVFLKKNCPSGGGLHPVEAYLLVQNVEGVVPGLYHYHPVRHALRPLPSPGRPLADLALEAVARQHWFANAHAMAILAPRYDRHFWKYRRHPKGLRVVTLEAGHLSQLLYLAATDAGLAAYITAAINEQPLERALGLDPLREGVLAVCGFGWRAATMETMELDPGAAVWQP